ncbi:primase C-terminal domain-containing protein [Planococcus sp. ISL-109]|uniref:primase C-terminal domain-containing protein n=1 Tax=Planococcus sp. ISL-109 TaxID=2819166 RepID=UPI001BE4F44D|nr:primase C-terminal domain-containing protein [Planococcus sp. ISL-109]MBT2583143.1 primase C-terminal domain-containing protein [Planococcus sp. ISL-109]
MKKIFSIIDIVLHEGLAAYKKVGSSASLPLILKASKKISIHKKGAIGVVRSKEDLSTSSGVKGYVVTSKETLLEDSFELSHWTPNVHNYLGYSDKERRHLKGHTETNLQQINTFVVDIDTKKQPYTEILTAALDHSVGIPTMVLETPKGFQVYFVLETPLFISNQNDYRGLKVAKRISENIRRSLAEVLQGVDLSCNDFGFFRMPSEENVRWFSDKMVFSMHNLIAWSKRQDDDQNRGLFVVESKGEAFDPTHAEWFQELLATRHVKGNSGQIGRDNLMYTLALACYSSGKGQGETLDLLDEYNSSLETPVRHSEVQKIVKSAYKGRFKGASQAYIQELLEAWLPGKSVPVTNHLGGWYKFKKERKDRVRSHYDEWEGDLLAYIQSETSTVQPIIWTTQSAVCEAVGIPRSTFNEVIRKSKKLLIKRIGKGRSAQTGLTSVAVLLQCALEYNQQHRALYYEAINLMNGSRENASALWELENQLTLLTKFSENQSLPGKKFNSS